MTIVTRTRRSPPQSFPLDQVEHFCSKAFELIVVSNLCMATMTLTFPAQPTLADGQHPLYLKNKYCDIQA